MFYSSLGAQRKSSDSQKQHAWSSLKFTEARSVFKKNWKLKTIKCKTCGAKNPQITKPTFGWIHTQMPLLHRVADGFGSHLQRRQLYATPMSRLRLLMICRMAKPEDVLIVEDENGNIVRETMKDNDVLVQYKVFILTCLKK